MSEELDGIFDDEVQDGQVPNGDDGSVPSLDSIDIDSIEDEALAGQLAGLRGLAQLDPSILESDEYKDIMNQLKNTSGDGSNADDEEEDENDELLPPVDLDDDEEDEEEEDDENPFISSRKSKKVKEIEFDDSKIPAEFNEVIKNHFGVDNASTFINSANTWRKQAQEYSEREKEYNQLAEDLGALPYEIKAQIDAWANGQDFLNVVQDITRLDYEADFNNQSPDELVKHYHKEQYDEMLEELEEGKITEEELDKNINRLAKTTKKFFDRDKQALKEQRDNYAKDALKRQESFKKSAIVSVDSLSKAYPDFSKSELNRVRNYLVEGKLDDLFFNPDGTYKPETAELIAFALNGKKILSIAERKGVKKGRMSEAQEIVDKSPTKLKKQSGAQRQVQDEWEGVEHLKGMIKADPYS